MLTTQGTAEGTIRLGEGAVARLLSDGRVEVTQGEVGSYRYRRLMDHETLKAGYAAWENRTPREADGLVSIGNDTWVDYHAEHIDFGGHEVEMVEGFGSRIGLPIGDVQRLISATTH